MTTLDAAFAVTPQGILARVTVGISDGIITHISGDPTHDVIPNDADVLLPGFVDVHIHGGGGADTMDATPEALQAVANAYSDAGNRFHCGVWEGGVGHWRVQYTEHEFCHLLSGQLDVEGQAVAVNETLVVTGEESIRLECQKKTAIAFFTLQAR